MKKMLAWLLLTVLTALCCACGEGTPTSENVSTSETTSASDTTSTSESAAASEAVAPAADQNFVYIKVKDFGGMVAELYPEVAPITVANFKKLVADGFYDGLIFHRIKPGFVIQGGDPTGTGYYGSDEKIKGEFAANGVPNDLSHTRGVLSMARSQDMNSASSQFFIVMSDRYVRSLDGLYAGFGKVIWGMETADAIAAVPLDTGDKPLTDVVIEKAILCTRTEAESYME